MNRSPESETTRVTITLPTALVHLLDEQLVNGDADRSMAIRRLIEAALNDREVRTKREREAEEEREQYVRAWREQPQTEEEFGWMTHPGTLEHLTEIPWDSDAAPSGGPSSPHHGDADRSS